MEGAPDWQDGECCFRCRTQFTLVARKHHCRNCGNIFCAKCSSQQIPLPKINIDKPVRVCDGCFEKLSTKEEQLALALDKKKTEQDQTLAKSKSSSSKSSSSGNSKTSGGKSSANASAPSEQELKEEEELQLALALSLSEAPAKVSFPDCKQFEEPVVAATPTSATATTTTTINNVKDNLCQPVVYPTDIAQYVPTPEKTQPPNSIQPQYSQENQSVDQDLFKFVAEVQSTAEVFTNRINSNKMRNRPIANDSPIQALFLKLTNMHAKILEYIKIHDDERARFESVQDKLSQISDARAALDALREEHQEKIRQEAAEAERQRQTQLALKLEMMRQKKSQMMQYQREVALQRIQAQELMLRQPQGYPTTSSASTVPTQQVVSQPPVANTSAIQQQSTDLQLPPQPQQPTSIHQFTTVVQSPQSVTVPVSQPIVQQQPLFQQQLASHSCQPQFNSLQQHQLNQSIQQPQSLPVMPKADDEAPLISFDD